ncbi:MAG: ABC transporter substrate-binding protein [Candidatus Dormibacteraeota bacterium]|nr:ABC transporter substrate-binding protein [Candidatus Dormibacteraeota bacterium]
MSDFQRQLDEVRGDRSEVQNHVIDELLAGRISRREFIRAGSVVGMSLPLLSFIAACGTSTPAGSSGGGGSVKKGGKITVGLVTPAHEVDPFKVSDEGGLALISQMGEFLADSNKDLTLQPRLAESWKPNSDGTMWTFKIRTGVTFNDGTPMTADDVAFTINLHADPANGSNALSAFKGVLSKGAAKATDATTVEVHLDSANGNFPYLVSSDNYNLIILPKTYTGGFNKTWPGTGPWKVTAYQTGASMTTVRNPTYWDKSNTPPLDEVDWKFFQDESPRILALQGNTLQLVSHFSPSNGQALFSDSNITVIDVPTSQHRQVHMRTDMEPFTDKRVRQAVALSLNRPQLVQGLLNGKAQVANDSPFFKVFPSTDSSISQRTADMTKAKSLLSAAGKSSGFAVTLSTWRGFEIPDYAQLIQSAVKPLGINITLNITDASTYYGDAVFGKSTWLDSNMGITDYGHRAVPNVFLGAPLVSTGVWNSAHFKNDQYDALFKQYVAALDLTAQKKVSGQIQQLLLDETPIIFAYNYDILGASRSNLTGVIITGIFQVDLRKAGFKS